MALACHCVLNRQKSLQGRLELALASSECAASLLTSVSKEALVVRKCPL